LADEAFKAGQRVDGQRFREESHRLEREAERLVDAERIARAMPLTPPTDDQRRALVTHFMSAIVATVRIASSDMTEDQAWDHYGRYARDIHIFAEALARKIIP